MSAKPSLQGQCSATPSSSSSASPTSQRESSTISYSNTPSTPRLDTITEHMATAHHGKTESLSRTGSISSISFLPEGEPASASRGDPKQREIGRRRTTSPPAPSKFESHVSFDNIVAGGDPTEHNTVSFTLNEKHMGYQRKRQSRTFMVGIDENSYSNYALQWMLDEMVDDGDEIVCLRVVEKDSKISNEKSVSDKQYQKEARRLMKDIQAKNDEHKSISIVLEFAVGKLHPTFQKMIQLYEPAMLIVGTRGRSFGGVQGLINNRNSFSKWCLQYSPIPVVVVRPTEKRDKKKAKRANDPTRHSYAQMLQDSGVGTHEANAMPKDTEMQTQIHPMNAPEMEAHEVAAALALPARFDPTIREIDVNSQLHLSKIHDGHSDDMTVYQETSTDSRPSSLGDKAKPESVRRPGQSDDETEDEDGDGDFEVTSGQTLIGDEPKALEKQQKLQAMEKGEAAALAAGRKGSTDSSISNSGNDQG